MTDKVIKQSGLQITWNTESIQSIIPPLDVEDEIVAAMSADIKEEIDNEIIDQLDPEGAPARKIEREIRAQEREVERKIDGFARRLQR